MRNILIWIVFFIFGFSSVVFATDVRVDALAGIDTVLWDETTDLNPYNLGNPAGMALLPTGGRIDITVPGNVQLSSTGSLVSNYIGVSPGASRFANPLNAIDGVNGEANFQYQGFSYITPDHWAFQETGGFDWTGAPGAQNTEEEREQALVAKQVGILTFGTEFLYAHRTVNTLNSAPISYEGDGGTFTTGLTANFQLGDGGHPVWLRLGGAVNVNLVVPDFGAKQPGFASQATLVEYFPNTTFLPQVVLEVPGVFQAAVQSNIQSNGVTVDWTFVPATPSLLDQTYLWNQNNNQIWTADYKWRIMLSDDKDPQPLTFNNGMLLTTNLNNGTGYNANGTVNNTFQNNNFFYSVGLGLERQNDFTFGIQGNFSNEVSTQTVNGAVSIYQNSTIVSLACGVERWVSPEVALRLSVFDAGLSSTVYPDSGNSEFSAQFGVGFKRKDLQVDGTFYYSPITTTAQNTSASTNTTLGFELACVYLFGASK